MKTMGFQVLCLALLFACSARSVAAIGSVTFTASATGGSSGVGCATPNACTLKEIVTYIQGDYTGWDDATIYLSPGSYGYAAACDLAITEDYLYIEGIDETTVNINCEGTSRFIDYSAAVSGGGVSNVTITGGHETAGTPGGTAQGGTFRFSGAGTLSNPISLHNVHVRNSQITGGGWSTTGACADFRDSFVDIDQSSFIGCTNNGGKLSGGHYIKNGHVKATFSTFSNNYGSVGGAMLSEGDQNSEFTDCLFENNEATCCGGVIDDGGTSNTTFTRCTFRNSVSNEGAVYYGFSGGGTRFINCTSYDSYAGANGGLFFFSSQSRGHIEDFLGYNVYAVGDGGVYRHASQLATPKIINSHFENVFAGKCSGGFTQDNVIELNNVSYKNMTSSLYGGLCLQYADPGKVSDITLENVDAKQKGALTVILRERDIEIPNLTIDGATAQVGAGIHVTDLTGDGNCFKTSNTVVSNTRSETGTIYLSDACFEMTTGTVSGNSATRGSMTYFSGTGASASFTDVDFVSNEAKEETTGRASLCGGSSQARGGFYYEDVDSNFPRSANPSSCPFDDIMPSFTRASFSDNTAEGAGALGFFESRSEAFITCDMDDFCLPANNCSYSGNVAGEYGSNLATLPATIELASGNTTIIPSKGFDMSWTAFDGFGQQVKGAAEDGDALAVLLTTPPAGVSVNGTCNPYCGLFDPTSNEVSVNALSIEAEPGTSVNMTFYTEPATVSRVIEFTIEPCETYKSWDFVRSRCVFTSCPLGSYLIAPPTDLPYCQTCPPVCSDTYWTYTTSECSDSNEREVTFAFNRPNPFGAGALDCSTATTAPGTCPPGVNLPAPFKADCDYVVEDSGIAIGFMIIIVICMLVQVFFIVIMNLNKKAPVIKKAQPKFLTFACIGAIIGMASVFVALGEWSTETCQAMLAMVTFGFSLMYGSLVVKMWRIDKIFNNKTLSKVNVTDKKMLIMVGGIMAVDALVFALFCIVDKFEAGNAFREVSGYQIPFFECVTDSDTFGMILIVTKIFVLLYGVYMCWMLRGVPADFQEVKWISMGMYNTAIAVIVVVPLYVLIDLDNEVLFAIYCVGVMYAFMSSTCLVIIPKILALKYPKMFAKAGPQATIGSMATCMTGAGGTVQTGQIPTVQIGTSSGNDPSAKLQADLATKNAEIKKLQKELEEAKAKAQG